MKKIVITKHGGGELANQLWNYAAIQAFGLETGAPVRNPSFFEYHSFFRFLPDESVGTRLLSRFFQTPRRRSHAINKIGRAVYAAKVRLSAPFISRCIYSSENNENRATHLPPTSALPTNLQNCDTLHFTGWLFRNRAGLEKFSAELRGMFAPQQAILDRADSIISPLRSKYPSVIGIHIRQSDYIKFKGGKFAISQARVREIVGEYAREKPLDLEKTAFVIASDGPVDVASLAGLNTYVSKENSVTDLFLLSRTDAILGSDSSFGAFAAWYANVPHIIFKNEPIDWAYYSDKKSFFENKYTSLQQY